MPDLLSSPWQIQLALGSGYAAYLLAYMGRREHHKAIDTTFRTLAFGLVATVIISLLTTLPVYVVVPAAFVPTILAGALWRKFGMTMYDWAVRKADVSWSDDTPTAWQSITVCNSKHFVSQISVQLEDGSWLRCIDTRRFEDSPFGPATFGSNGDVAIYVTDEESATGEDVDIGNVDEPYWGPRLTYIPASRIRRVALRHQAG